MSQHTPLRQSRRPANEDCRCLCGNLLARWVADGVELKCRRCKRTVHLPLSSISRDGLRPVRAIPVGEAG
ncbi:MAG: hypothetical protein QNK04_08930 [Myxococcota bacterium]|nr:hypothetical protein [Myxococcota bacterium]